MRTKLLRFAAVVTVAMGASACSSVPDWVDPTTWMGDSTPPSQGADNGQTPDLADLPAKPTPESTPDDQKQVSDSLTSDRSQANYSGDQLRGGTEPAAAPPEAADPNVANAEAAPAASPPPADASATPAAPAPDASTPSASTPAPSDPAPAPAAPDTSAPATPPSNQSSQAAPDPAQADAAPPAQEAAAAPPPGAEPAVPMIATSVASPMAAPAPAAPVVASVGTVNPSDAALGFKPSSAPPLDPSVSQFVAMPIVAHYRQTAAMSGAASGAMVVASVAPLPRRSHSAMGGPEMSGAVVANLDAIQSAPAAAYSGANGSPAAVIFFPGDGTALNAEGRAKVREAVAAFKSGGGQGFVHVVGHSSSRTPDMPVEKHLEVIFLRSKERADAVARELIREGVPAAKVLVDAVGDSQPIYYESMPKGEDGNRRAEIFLQG